MVFLPLASTLLILGLATFVQTSNIRAVQHRGLAERIAHPVPLAQREPSARKMQRRSCKPPSVSSSLAVAAPPSSTNASTSVAVVATAPAETLTTTTRKVETSTTSTTLKHVTTSSSTAATSGQTSTSSSSNSGHQFTLTNKCSNAVSPVVVSTACGYSPRCSDASTATLPSVGSLAAGKTTTITVPKNFVGRIFSQDGSCGSKGEDCTMLEFNLDADSFYTPQSYDISNIQGFTQSISVGAEGCTTATCTNASCSCESAYPIGDETGCGNDLPVKACGAGNIAFSVVFCP